MKRIFVCSPYRGANHLEERLNRLRVDRLCRLVVLDGHAPFAPHGFFPYFLDEHDEVERAAGIQAGLCYLATCRELWAWTRRGTSRGMAEEISTAKGLGIPVIENPPAWIEVTE